MCCVPTLIPTAQEGEETHSEEVKVWRKSRHPNTSFTIGHTAALPPPEDVIPALLAFVL